MVGFLLFCLQCRINVLSLLCGALDFPQNGLFLQNFCRRTNHSVLVSSAHLIHGNYAHIFDLRWDLSCIFCSIYVFDLVTCFPPFFRVACLFIWKTFILHRFKDKRWNTGACILSNLAEYTVVLSNFLSSAHLGFVFQFKRAVAHHAAGAKNAPRQLKAICGTEKSILKKKKKKAWLLWWLQWQQITLAERRRMGPTSVHDKICSPWQQASGRGRARQEPCAEQGHAVPQLSPCPGQASQLCRWWKASASKAPLQQACPTTGIYN